MGFAEQSLGLSGEGAAGRFLLTLPLPERDAARIAVLHDCLLVAIRAGRVGAHAATGADRMHGRLRLLRVRYGAVCDALRPPGMPAPGL